MADKDSILDSTKKILGLDPEYTAFDLDVIMHINSAFFELNQLGVGPERGFSIADSESKWQEFIGEESIEAVKTLVALKVRLLFDPPATSFHLKAVEDQIAKFEWRLNVHMEGVRHPSVSNPPMVIST